VIRVIVQIYLCLSLFKTSLLFIDADVQTKALFISIII